MFIAQVHLAQHFKGFFCGLAGGGDNIFRTGNETFRIGDCFVVQSGFYIMTGKGDCVFGIVVFLRRNIRRRAGGGLFGRAGVLGCGDGFVQLGLHGVKRGLQAGNLAGQLVNFFQ